MEGEKKRWSVTYTKHIKQKRKVYQDGFLDLHIPTNKLMLYDESEKLLECRMLRKDEVVCSAQTLAFASFYVDVGDLQGSNFNSDAGGKSSKARPINLSPSQKIIREFKKSELQKYGAPQTSATTTKTSAKEWQVMYTTHITQKAKKYRDGFLQLTSSGTLQRQIMLYDGNKKLLNSRFLKKDEVIQSGESIAFDAHLVDIGEPEGNNQGLMDSDINVSNYNLAGKTGMIHRVQSCPKIDKSLLKGKPQKNAISRGYADPSFSNSSNIDETKLSRNVSANKPLRGAIQILSILQRPMNEESIATGSINKNIMNPVPFAKEPQNSDSTRNIPEISELSRISVAHDGSNEKLDDQESSECIEIKKSPDLYSKEKSSRSGNKSLKNTEVGNSDQPHLHSLEAYTKCSEASMLGGSSPIVQTSQDTVDVTNNSVELQISREAGLCPSFDLGFD